MSLFSIGLTGLHTANIALNTTGNNISNIYTPGYNRELILLAQSNSGGVRVTDVQRQFDHFISSQLNTANSSLKSLEAYRGQISQIDSLLADQESGLAPVMHNFFEAIQDLAGAPGDPAARQGVIGTADVLAAQFRSFDEYFHTMSQGINEQIHTEVTQINNTVEQLANINREIILAKARTGEPPNTLLNQRDQLVAELSERADIRITIQDGDVYNISLGSGQPLVAGNAHYTLSAVASAADPGRLVVGYQDAAGNVMELPEKSFTKGSLGGLMTFRAESLDPTQNHLGLMAASLVLAFNEVHEAGLDLAGDAGQPLFEIRAPQIFSHDRNEGSAVFTAEFGTPAELTGADYDLRFLGGDQFEVTRRDNGQTETLTLNAANTLSVGGVTLTLDNPDNLEVGDRFQLQPTRRAAAGMENLISDPSHIAAGLEPGSGDNRNALAMLQLQNKAIVSGNATLSQSYAALVSDVGNRSSIVKVNQTSQESLTGQIRAMQQSVSGVNLDEEYANLIRYQQYYQANARVIDTASTVIDTLLGLRN